MVRIRKKIRLILRHLLGNEICCILCGERVDTKMNVRAYELVSPFEAQYWHSRDCPGVVYKVDRGIMW